MAVNSTSLADEDGDYSDWIELHNASQRSVDLAGFFLTDSPEDLTKWRFPAHDLPSDEYLVVFASSKDRVGAELHTNFKIDRDGEPLLLIDRDGVTVLDEVHAVAFERSNVSYGRSGSGPREFGFFADPTPASANGIALHRIVPSVTSNVEHGFFTDTFLVSLSSSSAEVSIRYTTDGSTPTLSSPEYQVPLTVNETTILRAVAFAPNQLPSDVMTQTYVFLSDVIRQSPQNERPDESWPEPNRLVTKGAFIDYGMDPQIVDDPRYADEIFSALMSIPTISLVTDLKHLFDSKTGIYANPSGSGRTWERPVSMELIHADGTAGFQIDAGMRIRGSSSANLNFPKHGFRFFFRSQYGDPVLKYPLFGNEGVDEFVRIDLRTSQSWAWQNGSTRNNLMNREVFYRDTQRDLGQPYTRSRYYHLYLNGQYWGLYQSEERPDATYAVSYFGGEREDYDVIKQPGVLSDFLTDGTLDAWRRLWQFAVTGFASDADYYRVQGRDPNGMANPELEVLLDVDNLIDYMLIVYYSGTIEGPICQVCPHDVNNFFNVLDRTGREGFQFFIRDFENAMGSYRDDRTGPFEVGAVFESFNAQWLFQRLMEHAEFRIRFADRAHQVFFNEGVMTSSASIERFQARADQIRLAVIAESARWGDTQSVRPATQSSWEYDIRSKVRAYFPRRSAKVVEQLRNQGWYPLIDAPEFLINQERQHGGEVQAGDTLSFYVPEMNGTVYYTTDGSDPRLPGGEISLKAHVLEPNAVISIDRATQIKARTFEGEHWSAVTEATFFLTGQTPADGLRMSEIHYHPTAPSPDEIAAGYDDPDDFEFIEITNIGDVTVLLDDVALVQTTVAGNVEGVRFDFVDADVARLPPGARLVVVEDLDAFQFRYGHDVTVAGQWVGGLNNRAETVQLQVADQMIQQIRYRDSWFPKSDGRGPSLVARQLQHLEGIDWSANRAWRPSSVAGGTPGFSEPVVGDVDGDGRFTAADLTAVSLAGEYDDGIEQNSHYREGDWDGDGDFDSEDIVFAFQFGEYMVPAAAIQTAASDSDYDRTAARARALAATDAAFAEDREVRLNGLQRPAKDGLACVSDYVI